MEISKSLCELEGVSLGKPEFESGLVIRYHELWTVPLQELSCEDLRLLIGQKVGLPYLVPLALDALEFDPLEEGDLYPGALLYSVVGVPIPFWIKNPSLLPQIESLARKAMSVLEIEDKELCDRIGSALRAMKGEWI